jgi:hypothetical protein
MMDGNKLAMEKKPGNNMFAFRSPLEPLAKSLPANILKISSYSRAPKGCPCTRIAPCTGAWRLADLRIIDSSPRVIGNFSIWSILIYTAFGCYESRQEFGIEEFDPEFHCLEWQGNEDWKSDPIPRGPPEKSKS